jgi:hypothetical protein
MRGGSFVLHGLGVDEIGVVVIKDEELGVALAAGDGETTSLISEDFAGGLDGGGVAQVSAFSIWKRGWEEDIFDDLVGSERARGLGGVLVLAGLVEVAFLHGDRGWWILGEEVGCEAGEAD